MSYTRRQFWSLTLVLCVVEWGVLAHVYPARPLAWRALAETRIFEPPARMVNARPCSP